LEHFDIKTYGKYFVNFKEDENALYIALWTSNTFQKHRI
jgi:hypothetical protein